MDSIQVVPTRRRSFRRRLALIRALKPDTGQPVCTFLDAADRIPAGARAVHRQYIALKGREGPAQRNRSDADLVVQALKIFCAQPPTPNEPPKESK